MSIRDTDWVEYCALKNAIHRCHKESHPAYKNYGARGIEVFEEWRDLKTGYAKFLAHVGRRPTPLHTLDRIDNSQGYMPGNLRWADRKTRAANRRRPACHVQDYGWGLGKVEGAKNGAMSALIPFEGRIQTIVDWAKERKIATPTIRQRLAKGLTPEQALFQGRLPQGTTPSAAHQALDTAIETLTAAIDAIQGRQL